MARMKLIYKHSSTATKPTSLDAGEIAITYGTGKEGIWLKNSVGTIVGLSFADMDSLAAAIYQLDQDQQTKMTGIDNILKTLS